MSTSQKYKPSRLYFTSKTKAGDSILMKAMPERDLIAQNLLIIAYENPCTLAELAETIEIPLVYIASVLNGLVNCGLIIHTDDDKYYTNFIIFNDDDFISGFNCQQKFVRDNFDVFAEAIASILLQLSRLEFTALLNIQQLRKLERYAVLKALQMFQLRAQTEKLNNPENAAKYCDNILPLYAYKCEIGKNNLRYRELDGWKIISGPRSIDVESSDGTQLTLNEFETEFLDCPERRLYWGNMIYINCIIPLIWHIYKGRTITEADAQYKIADKIPDIINRTGMLARDACGNIIVNIPVLSSTEYKIVDRIVNAAFMLLNSCIGDSYREFLKNSIVPVPPQLEASVPRPFRYMPATNYIAMTAIREACERKIHLHDVDYCCPAVVLVYD